LVNEYNVNNKKPLKLNLLILRNHLCRGADFYLLVNFFPAAGQRQEFRSIYILPRGRHKFVRHFGTCRAAGILLSVVFILARRQDLIFSSVSTLPGGSILNFGQLLSCRVADIIYPSILCLPRGRYFIFRSCEVVRPAGI